MTFFNLVVVSFTLSPVVSIAVSSTNVAIITSSCYNWSQIYTRYRMSLCGTLAPIEISLRILKFDSKIFVCNVQLQ